MNDFNGTYVIDNTHSSIGFWVRHAMVTKVRGEFKEYDSTIVVDMDNTANSSAKVTIQAESIDTRNADRDAHMRTADFFDTENHKEITFVSTSLDLKNETEGTLTGDLTIKGITKPVTLDVEIIGQSVDPYGNTRLGFEAKTLINRKDFNIDFNAPLGSGGVLLSEDINVEIEISAIRQDA